MFYLNFSSVSFRGSECYEDLLLLLLVLLLILPIEARQTRHLPHMALLGCIDTKLIKYEVPNE